jgi:adenosylmethionine---8-amino-7-oxononanoate aminotransferase
MKASPSPAEVRRWDVEHLWHPFTQMAEYAEAEPLVVVSGDGHYLIDDRGRRLFDATSALWCNLFGHRVPEIDAAVRAQLDRFAHTTLLGTTHPGAAELARRLVEISPTGLSHVFLSDNGATAVEAALKMAFQYRLLTRGADAARQATFLSIENAYHGDTLGAAAVGGVALFHETFRPILLPTLRVPVGHLEEVEATLAREGGRVCAVLMEPGVQAAAGMIPVPDGFLRGVADAARRHDALLILDEVATGFGRTGTMFACQKEGVTPDLLCLAKGLTGGYLPVAATLASDAVYRAFLGRYSEYRHFFHGHTYTGNALGCAAALATLELLRERRVVESVPAKSTVLREALRPIAAHPNVGEIRLTGLMGGIELLQDRPTRAPFATHERVGYRIGLALRDQGVFARPLGDVMVLMPPLTSTDAELRMIASALEISIRAILPA